MKHFLTTCLLLSTFIYAKGVSPQQWLVEKLGLDAYSVTHYVGANWYARGMTSVSLWELVNREPCSNNFTIATGLIGIVGWEVGQRIDAGSYDNWAKVYGGVDEAWRNTLVDIGLGVFGLYAGLRWRALKKPKVVPDKVSYNGLTKQVQIGWRF